MMMLLTDQGLSQKLEHMTFEYGSVQRIQRMRTFQVIILSCFPVLGASCTVTHSRGRMRPRSSSSLARAACRCSFFSCRSTASSAMASGESSGCLGLGIAGARLPIAERLDLKAVRGPVEGAYGTFARAGWQSTQQTQDVQRRRQTVHEELAATRQTRWLESGEDGTGAAADARMEHVTCETRCLRACRAYGCSVSVASSGQFHVTWPETVGGRPKLHSLCSAALACLASLRFPVSRA